MPKFTNICSTSFLTSEDGISLSAALRNEGVGSDSQTLSMINNGVSATVCNQKANTMNKNEASVER